MPPLFEMDDYEECMLDPEGTYCISTLDLNSKGHSSLMDFLQQYSAATIKHFNHTRIHRGVCVSSCRHHLNTSETTMDPGVILEGCVNVSMWRNYELEARLSKLDYCKKYDDKTVLDTSDYTVATVYALIILLNIIGSLYDVMLNDKDQKTGNQYLLAFSLHRNWKKLVAPAGSRADPRIERLKLFYGIRAMTMMCVIFSHTVLMMSLTFIKNPIYNEKAYDDPLKYLIFNGFVIVSTFFVMSGFLLAYNLQIFAETREINWMKIPIAILTRWLRLTPAYALIIATISTWMRHVGNGPLWPLVVTSEANVCRQYWWANIFYFNNYVFRDDTCFPPGWYLAADTQLFCLGLVFLVMVRRPYHRKVGLVVLFLVSLLITAAHTYFQDLGAIVLQSPESYRKIFVDDDTFLNVYIRGHTNISTYTLGLAGGLLTYHWQKTEKDFSKYKKYRWVIWLLFPLGVATILSGGVFYIDGYTHPTFVRVFYAALYKPFFQAIVVALMMGVIFKVETVYRGIVEWHGFTLVGRLSYSAFLLHTMFQRAYVGSQIDPLYISDYHVTILLCGSTFLSFVLGAVLWLMVEAPTAAISRAILTRRLNKKL